MLSTTTLWMPQAACSTDRPSGSATRAMAARAACHVQRHGAAQEEAGVVVAEHQIGVGHGGLLAAAAVAGRAGCGAGGVRADAQQPHGVDRGDRAAAGADLDHVDRGGLDRQARALLEAVLAPGLQHRGDLRAAVLDQAGLGGGAAHVEGEQVGVAGPRAQQRGGQRAAGRAGLQQPDREFARRLAPRPGPPAECISRNATGEARRRAIRAPAGADRSPSAAAHRRWRRS